MKNIPLTQGKFAIVDDEDFERLNKFKWCCSSKGYAVRNARKADGRTGTIAMHREIILTPIGLDTDHRNRNRLDNRRSNLRNAKHSENLWNAKPHRDNQSGLKGVGIIKGKYFKAEIQTDGNKQYLGLFKTASEAHAAYCSAAARLHGAFARTL